MTQYALTEVGNLHVGDEFIDRTDFAHTVTGIRPMDGLPGLVCIITTDLLPLGHVWDTVALVHRAVR